MGCGPFSSPPLVVLGMGFVSISYLARSLTSLYVMAALWGALAVGGSQSISYTKLISGWFVHHRGLAIGIAAAGLGAGYTIVPLIAAQLLAHFSWQAAFAALGGIIVVPFVVNLWTARPRSKCGGCHEPQQD